MEEFGVRFVNSSLGCFERRPLSVAATLAVAHIFLVERCMYPLNVYLFMVQVRRSWLIKTLDSIVVRSVSHRQTCTGISRRLLASDMVAKPSKLARFESE
jgi:hypothetical protein